MTREAVIVDCARSAFGKRKGVLAGWHPTDLLGFALRSVIERNDLDPGLIDDVVGGCVTQSGEQGTNVTRNAWVAAGLPQSVPATSVDRQCGSSQQAVHFAAQGVMSGCYDLAIACGTERTDGQSSFIRKLRRGHGNETSAIKSRGTSNRRHP